MSHARWSMPLLLSFGLFSCGGEDASAPVTEGGSEAVEAAPDGQDSNGTIVDELGETVEDVADAAIAEANTLIEKVTAYLAENKLDLAKTAFAQLEALKDKLPASYQGQIEKVRSLIEANGIGEKANDLINNLGGFGKEG